MKVCWSKSSEVVTNQLEFKDICSYPFLGSINILSYIIAAELKWKNEEMINIHF